MSNSEQVSEAEDKACHTLHHLKTDELNALVQGGFTIISAEGYGRISWANVLVLGPANVSPYVVLARNEFP